jgi:uncharacterized protein DUF6491
MTAPSRIALAVLAALGAALAGGAAAQTPQGPAGASAKPARQCFFSRNINGWTEVDDRSVILDVNVRDAYLAKLFGPCPEVRYTETIGVLNRGSDWICTGEDTFDLIVQDASRTGTNRCPVVSLRQLTPEEAKALTARKR